MNTEYHDILQTVIHHPGITSADIAEKMEVKGYYRTLKTAEAAAKVSKICDKLRSQGHLTAEKIRNPITGCMGNFWSPNHDRPQIDTDNQPEPSEMISDVTEINHEASMTEKPAEYTADELTEAVIEVIKQQAEKPVYKLTPSMFTLSDGNNHCDVEIIDSTAVIFPGRTGVKFETAEQIDAFASAIKQALSYAA